jgi:hypothetical protein
MNFTLYSFMLVIWGPIFFVTFLLELFSDFYNFIDDKRKGLNIFSSIYKNIFTFILFSGCIICTILGFK